MKKIQLRGKYNKLVLVSDTDFKWLNSYKWNFNLRGYAVKGGGKNRYASFNNESS